MNFPIPILELREYGAFILATWCIGSSNLASHIYSRFYHQKKIHPLTIQCIVKALICFVGLFFIPLQPLLMIKSGYQIVGIPTGLCLGWIYLKIELILNRALLRLKNNKTLNRADAYFYRYQSPCPSVLSISKKYATGSITKLKRTHEHYAASELTQSRYTLIIILSIAIFEEMLFRGYLVQCCYLLPHGMLKVCLIVTVIMFGLSHASFGIQQIICKTILGGFCLITVLFFHSLIPAFLLHGFLNWQAFGYQE